MASLVISLCIALQQSVQRVSIAFDSLELEFPGRGIPAHLLLQRSFPFIAMAFFVPPGKESKVVFDGRLG